MIAIDFELLPADLLPDCDRLWKLAPRKIARVAADFPPGTPTPVITKAGKYTPQGWTEWTQGFLYGAALLVYDGAGTERLFETALAGIDAAMPMHVTHFGVHDHGFNNVSTYGNLRRLILEGNVSPDPQRLAACELALKASAAVQAMRWTTIADGGGFIYSFNGPHSLFADTIRSLRALAMGGLLGHRVLAENDRAIDLIERLLEHARATADYAVYYGEGRDAYDVCGRVAHESLFNANDGQYRCPGTQQGYSPFSTWTRGLAWVMLGYAEQLEFLDTLPDDRLATRGGRKEIEAWMERAARAACDFFIEQTPTDGIPYWDTRAPGLARLENYLDRPAQPENDFEPVDSSAAAIGCQGLMRLGRWLQARGAEKAGNRYWQAGLTTLRTLLSPPYLAVDEEHDGLLLHSIYHRPRNWDYIPPQSQIPNGEASMWGDYHLLEAALYLQRVTGDKPYYTFFGP